MRIDGGQVVQRRDPTGSIKGATINSGLEEDATYASPGGWVSNVSSRRFIKRISRW